MSFNDQSLLPAYARVSKELQSRLSRMAVGDRMPSERELCIEMGVSRVTLRKAMEPFHRGGFLETRRGGGTWLAKEVTPPRNGAETSARLIGLVVPSVAISLPARIVQGAEALAAERDFHVALAHDHGDMDYQIKQLARMVDGNVAGIAVFPDVANLDRPVFRDLIKRIKAKSIPLVMIDRYLPDIDTPSVLSDNVAGAYAATEHMILKGHRRLALLSFGERSGVSDYERRKGFLNALQDYGIRANPIHEAALGGVNHEELARKVVGEWLAADAARGAVRPQFDGIFCMQDNMAYGAFLALREAGFSVPKDVALVGYDNLNREIFQAAGLNLTSIDQPAEKIGRRAAALLIDQIEEGSAAPKPRHILLRPQLIVRDT